jgi:hypothetical protein
MQSDRKLFQLVLSSVLRGTIGSTGGGGTVAAHYLMKQALGWLRTKMVSTFGAFSGPAYLLTPSNWQNTSSARRWCMILGPEE